MVIAALVILGLCFGSFANALVWRLHEQEAHKGKKGTDEDYLARLSIRRGRSMCVHCKHELGAADLLPVVSWLALGGRCRYCRKPISVQYPLVELLSAVLFVASYLWWPAAVQGSQIAVFCLWLVLVVGFVALAVYDLRWMLLPNRLMLPMGVVAALLAAVSIATAAHPFTAVLDTALAVVVGGGLFYALFQANDRWIGGGDVKLGVVLGLVAGTPARSFLFIFAAAVLGTVVSVPLLAARRLKGNSQIPFGPFLILGLVIVQLFGAAILLWYQRQFLPFTL